MTSDPNAMVAARPAGIATAALPEENLFRALYGGFGSWTYGELRARLARRGLSYRARQALAFKIAVFAYSRGLADDAKRLMERHDAIGLSVNTARVYALCCLDGGSPQSCQSFLDGDVSLHPTDASFLKTAIAVSDRGTEAGLTFLNDLLGRHGLSPIPLCGSSSRRAASKRAMPKQAVTAFHRLGQDPRNRRTGQASQPGSPDGPMVSIIIPAFNAQDTIEVAIRGILQQTHGNVEAIIVDDASADATAEVVEAVAKTDPRVRLFRQPENRGPYCAQNRGLAEARGDYIRSHGADDWLHPQATELQLGAMLEAGAATSISYACGVLDTLAPTPLPGASVLRIRNMSSLMVPREVALAIGGWDNVRFSGDGEFLRRVALHTGQAALEVLPDIPLSLLLSSRTSLSAGGPFGRRSLRFGARWEYRQGYSAWHGALDGQSGTYKIPTERPFSIPHVMGPDRKTQTPLRRLLIADLADPERAAEVLGDLRGFGEQDGIFHYPHPQNAQTPFVEILRREIDKRGCRVVVSGESVEGSEVILSTPHVFENRLDSYPVVECPKWRVASRARDFATLNPLVDTMARLMFRTSAQDLKIVRKARPE